MVVESYPTLPHHPIVPTYIPYIPDVVCQVVPKEKITVTQRGLQIKVPAILNPEETVTLNIFMVDVMKVSTVISHVPRMVIGNNQKILSLGKLSVVIWIF